MTRLVIIVIAAIALVFPATASAQTSVKDKMKELLALEADGRFREAYLGWQMLLQTPSVVKNLANEDGQKVYFECHFCYIRTLYRVGRFDPKVKSREKFIAAAASMIFKLENSPNQIGWKIIGPKALELLEAEEPLRREYERLNAFKEKQ